MPVIVAVAIVGAAFHLNGSPVNDGSEAEGLLINSRMVQAAIHDYNTQTATLWRYPNEAWNPTRNLNEFVAQLPAYHDAGLNMVTVGMQGGHPRYRCNDAAGGGRNFSMFTSTGGLRSDAATRLTTLIEAAADEGIIVNVQFFYQNQDHQLATNTAVITATTNATNFLEGLGTGNILIEVCNECSIANYSHAALKPGAIAARISQIKGLWPGALVSANFGGKGQVGPLAAQNAVDWFSLHANGLTTAEMRQRIRALKPKGKPIVITEDSNKVIDLRAAVDEGAGWGYYEQGCEATGSYSGAARYVQGFQSPPVNWSINTPTKRAFFAAVEELTGGGVTPDPDPDPEPTPDPVDPEAETVANVAQLKAAINDGVKKIELDGEFVLPDIRGLLVPSGSRWWVQASSDIRAISPDVELGFTMRRGNETPNTDIHIMGVGGLFPMHGFKLEAIRMGRNSKITFAELYDNGRNGTGGGLCDGAVLEDSILHDNGSVGELGHGAAGLKWANCDGTIVRRSEAYDNIGNGFWWDVGAGAATVEDCDSHDNSRKGFHYEISLGPAFFTRCTASENGWSEGRIHADGGFRLVSSQNVTYTACTATHNINGNGFFFTEDSRPPVLSNVIVKSSCAVAGGDDIVGCNLAGVDCQ